MIDTVVDIVVIIWGSLILITLILAIVFGFILYRKIKALTRDIKATIDTAKQTGSEASQVLKSFKDVVAALRPDKTRSYAPASPSPNDRVVT